MKKFNLFRLCGCLAILLAMSGGPARPAKAADPARRLDQRMEIPSSFNPVGSGARALGMGGAFIAVADDATAASWNPGGLIQLERPEISAVGSMFHRVEDIEFSVDPSANGQMSVSKDGLNYLSAALPFSLWGRNMIVSANYQNLYDFTRKWTFDIQTDEPDRIQQSVDYASEGSLSALGLACAVQITPNLSFGFTVNFWEDGIYENKWEDRRYQRGTVTNGGETFQFEAFTKDRYSFSGINANLGILWNVSAQWTLGAVFKTPFEAGIAHDRAFQSVVRDSAGVHSQTFNAFSENATLDMPMSYGIGISYRFSKRFTAAIDFYRTEWDDFVLTDENGNKTSPITGRPLADSGIDATHQLRMGCEYLIIQPKYVVPLRAGVFYDPAPAQGSPDDFYGLTLGSGFGYGRFIFDMAVQYRFGHDVGDSILKTWGYSQDVEEVVLYSSLIVHF
jgi:long-subunit fatty acid transport protein